MGVNKCRRFVCEALSFTHRYVPVGLLERLPTNMNERPFAFRGRDELEVRCAVQILLDTARSGLSRLTLFRSADTPLLGSVEGLGQDHGDVPWADAGRLVLRAEAQGGVARDYRGAGLEVLSFLHCDPASSLLD